MPDDKVFQRPDRGWVSLSKASWCSGRYAELSPACDSPIELSLLGGLIREGRRFEQWDGWRVDFRSPAEVEAAGGLDAAARAIQAECDARFVVLVTPQYPVAGYRLDFMMRCLCAVSADPAEWRWLSFALECDGHGFHSSRERLERDHERDLHLFQRGILTIRISGSEIWHEAHEWAVYAYSLAHRFFRGEDFTRWGSFRRQP